jgi:hypothetical protein
MATTIVGLPALVQALGPADVIPVDQSLSGNAAAVHVQLNQLSAYFQANGGNGATGPTGPVSTTPGPAGPVGATGPTGPGGGGSGSGTPVRTQISSTDAPTLVDKNGIIGYDNATGTSITINDLGLYVRYDCYQLSSGLLSFYAGLNVTLWYQGSTVNAIQSAWQGAKISALCTGTNTVYLEGDLAGAGTYIIDDNTGDELVDDNTGNIIVAG